MYARELVQQGYIGEVVSANMSVISQAVIRRGEGRIWQGDRRNGANTLTISGGHAIDALCFVLGEFEERARVGYLAMAAMEIELGERLGRKVDLRTPAELSRDFRDHVVQSAEVQYSAV